MFWVSFIYTCNKTSKSSKCYNLFVFNLFIFNLNSYVVRPYTKKGKEEMRKEKKGQSKSKKLTFFYLYNV